MHTPPQVPADFDLESYDYDLPKDNIAQHPAKNRDRSRLLIYDKKTTSVSHTHFSAIVDLFKKGDILVINDTKVFPARLLGKKTTGGKAEVFLLELPLVLDNTDPAAKTRNADAAALIKSSKRPSPGTEITIAKELSCLIVGQLENGKMKIELKYPADQNIIEILSRYGSVPLPPYIERSTGVSTEDQLRYQTVYAAHDGAVAAPTAGLHFTQPLLEALAQKGVSIATLTLHVGYGTFAPVRTEDITRHQIHSEYISLSSDTAEKINTTKKMGGKVWAVGTTTVRALEFSCDNSGLLQKTEGFCDLYIVPGYKFKIIDNLITNFHLPKSSLLFLVSAFCGRENMLQCYKKAIANNYRFYSYGDAMAILS